ncbi:MAG: ABC transporter permease, partial [Pseudorhodobacter sp.]
MALSPLNQRRWRNFKANRRAFWSLWLLAFLYGLSLFAEVLANDKPLLVSYRGEIRAPFLQFYSEAAFGGDFRTEAKYNDPEVRCLIRSGGVEACLDDPDASLAALESGSLEGAEPGWVLWPPIPYSFNTINNIGRAAPS